MRPRVHSVSVGFSLSADGAGDDCSVFVLVSSFGRAWTLLNDVSNLERSRVMDEGVNSWTYVGIAIRMAQELGLHRNLDRFRYKLPVTPDIKAEMRRTWFCCCEFALRQNCHPGKFLIHLVAQTFGTEVMAS